MDRNSAIGLTLIAALLLVYFYWFAPTPPPPSATSGTDTTATTGTPTAEATQPDSVTAASYGDLSSFVYGEQQLKTVETENLKVTFSNKGAVIRELELKNYKTYKQQPLKLVTPSSTQFKLTGNFKGSEVNLYSLLYGMDERKNGDTTVITFTLAMADGAQLQHIYRIPDRGYEIRYDISQKGFAQSIGGDKLAYEWNDIIRPLEKDLQDTRTNTTVTRRLANGEFDYLAERSTSLESETLTTPVQWVSIKRKFFLSSLVARNVTFTNGEISTDVNPNDTSYVKKASVKLGLAKDALAKTMSFTYYFGPNDYQEIGDIADEFAKNVYLGWPPVYWINKYAIFPVFHFLTMYIGNYGLIIVILVLLLKLVLFPLSYKSYLSMAKMKVLKPDLDVIKEKHGDDMTKVQQEQLKLYQQVGVNPISGCIPVLLQMPILFAMFYLFPASIELRQQPFLWAEDLSTYDSLIQLPFTMPFGVGSHISLFTLLMTVSTLVYTWQNNQLSSVQGPMKSMSYIMPIIFFFVLNSFSSGLTFYYFVSNLVTFAQQAFIRKFVDENKIKAILEDNRKRNLTGTGKKSKFMSKLEDAMKASEEARKRAEEEKKKRKK